MVQFLRNREERKEKSFYQIEQGYLRFYPFYFNQNSALSEKPSTVRVNNRNVDLATVLCVGLRFWHLPNAYAKTTFPVLYSSKKGQNIHRDTLGNKTSSGPSKQWKNVRTLPLKLCPPLLCTDLRGPLHRLA